MDISRSNRDIAQMAGENRSVAIPSFTQNSFEKSKYQRWYEALCAKAKSREIPTCYTEVHHIHPRSLGGSDDPSNLVRLTYREHYTAHHLLTKFHTGINLAKMQKALFAMTLKTSGERLTTAWQFEAAKRAVRDIELNDEVQAAWYERRQHRQRKAIEEQYKRSAEEQLAKDIKHLLIFPEMQEQILRAIAVMRPAYAVELAKALVSFYAAHPSVNQPISIT